MIWNIHSNTLFMWCNLNWWKEVMYSFMHSIILQDNIASDLHWPYFLPNRYWTLTLILITNGANKSFQTNVPTISIDTHRLDMPWIKVSIHAHRYICTHSSTVIPNLFSFSLLRINDADKNYFIIDNNERKKLFFVLLFGWWLYIRIEKYCTVQILFSRKWYNCGSLTM